MREHGTRVAYAYGIEPGQDRSKGCRCESCADANRLYAREHRRRQNRAFVHGIEEWQPAYVDNSEAREHLAWLTTQGVGLRTVEKRIGISRTSLLKIRSGKVTQSRPETIEKILGVGRSAVRGAALVDAAPTWKMIDDMVKQGYRLGWIGQQLGAETFSLQLRKGRIQAKSARKVAELYERTMFRVLEDRRISREARAHYRAIESANA
jgi:hypothetical protein